MRLIQIFWKIAIALQCRSGIFNVFFFAIHLLSPDFIKSPSLPASCVENPTYTNLLLFLKMIGFFALICYMVKIHVIPARCGAVVEGLPITLEVRGSNTGRPTSLYEVKSVV